MKIALIADFRGDQDVGTLDIAFQDKSTGDPDAWTWGLRRRSHREPIYILDTHLHHRLVSTR